MRHGFAALIVTAVFTAALPTSGRAADDENARLREMLHRTQEALRQAQADNADLTRAKLDAEHKLQDTAKQLDGVKGASKSAQASKASLQTQLDAARSLQASLQRNLDDANNKLGVTNSKLGELFKLVGAQTAELKQVKESLEQSQKEASSCEVKNVALYGYAEEVIERYKNKGVWASMAQKDPVLGLKEVEVENVVQEYQLKIDSQKVKP